MMVTADHQRLRKMLLEEKWQKLVRATISFYFRHFFLALPREGNKLYVIQGKLQKVTELKWDRL
jgi:hypothetical protein